MKHWIGFWLMGVAALHTLFTFVASGKALVSIAQRGVFNSVGDDPMTGGVVWSAFFGIALFTCGLAIVALEKSSPNPIPKSIGWCLLIIIIVGVVLMPISGFWLAFPPALAVVLKKHNV